MGKILVIIFFAFCIGCEINHDDPLKHIQVEEMDNYLFEFPFEFQTEFQILSWIKDNILPQKEEGDYWQLPEETYALKTGDCEDFSILALYLYKHFLSIEGQLVVLSNSDDTERHSIIKIGDYYIEPQLITKDLDITKLKTVSLFKNILYEIPFKEMIWMTYYYHNSVGKYY